VEVEMEQGTRESSQKHSYAPCHSQYRLHHRRPANQHLRRGYSPDGLNTQIFYAEHHWSGVRGEAILCRHEPCFYESGMQVAVLRLVLQCVCAAGCSPNLTGGVLLRKIVAPLPWH
jgi:hypothetical protein